MLQGLFNRAQRSIDALVSTYVRRLAIAVPFVISIGFTTAIAVVWLSQEYGSLTAYTVLASVFAVIGVLTMAAIAASTPHHALPSQAVTQEMPAVDAPQIAPAIDTELLLTTLGAVGPVALPALLRLIARNLPLLLGVLVLAYLLLAETKNSETVADPTP